ncbi:hypothetical protein R3P38DRAFT_15940 [Favolaschia claudopus]|uniref:F-box domain-containing protein n=1 Tax=Favolaschia claudopus TaxID=2862362 RepID=A0AAW0EE19_9AGAR
MNQPQPAIPTSQPPLRVPPQEMPEPWPHINGLPYELLTRILRTVLLVPPYKSGVEDGLGRPVEVVIMSWVCTLWRQVILNTPQLWAEWEFPITPPWKWTDSFYSLAPVATKMPVNIPMNNLFLERSAHVPISVALQYDQPHNNPNSPLVSSLLRNAQRWKSFTFSYDSFETDSTGVDYSLLSRIPVGVMENLERLCLVCPKLSADVADTFRRAPCLRDVTIELVTGLSHIPSIPWNQLTRLDFRYQSGGVCLDILAQCPNLVSVMICADQWSSVSVPDVSTPMTLDQLEKLRIVIRICSTGEHFGPFLRRFECPILKSLELALSLENAGDTEGYIPEVEPDLVPFLMQSSNIEELELSACVFSHNLSDILPLIPHLKEFEYSLTGMEGVNDEFFEALRYTPESESPPLAPKLQVLHIRDAGRDFDEQNLVKMIRSRWWLDDELEGMSSPPRVARLKDFSFVNNNHMDPPEPNFSDEFRQEMKTLWSQGLKLSIYVRP